MKEKPFVNRYGLALPKRCVGCPAIGGIIDSALTEMALYRKELSDVAPETGLIDFPTGTHRVFLGMQATLPHQLAPHGISIQSIIDTVQLNIENLSRNCPGM
jgi:hypothetical protein